MNRKIMNAIVCFLLIALLPPAVLWSGGQKEKAAGEAPAQEEAKPAVKDEAAGYPSRPIQYIVPWGPENESVAMARIIADEMGPVLGGNIVVTAMPGGSGSKALHYVLAQPADGYILLDAWVAPLIFVVLNRPDIGYTHEDFEPIGHTTFMPFTLAIRKNDARFKNFQEFVAYGKVHPGGMKYNATGAVSVPHAVMATFLNKAGIKANGVPYEGLAGGIPDFLGGTLDFTIGNFWVTKTYGDETLTLCVFMDERHPWYPDLPTAKELGYDPEYGGAGMGWDSLAVKKGTPEPIVRKLQEAYRKVATSERLINRLKEINLWLNYQDPQKTRQLWVQSMDKLGAGVKMLQAKQQ